MLQVDLLPMKTILCGSLFLLKIPDIVKSK